MKYDPSAAWRTSHDRFDEFSGAVVKFVLAIGWFWLCGWVMFELGWWPS